MVLSFDPSLSQRLIFTQSAQSLRFSSSFDLIEDENYIIQHYDQSYYDSVNTHIKSKNSAWTIMLNPGGPYVESLIKGKGASYKSVVYEDDYKFWDPATTCSAIQRDGWNGAYGTWPRGPFCRYL